MGIPFGQQIKNLWLDVKAMHKGLPANQYELGRYEELHGYLKTMFGHYNSGETGRLEADWSSSYDTPTANFKSTWRIIIARAIASTDNNCHTIGLLNALTSNIIGTGLRPQPRVKFASGEMITGLNYQLSEGWKRYNDEWDATGRQTHLEAQKMRFGEMFRTGTTITNRVKSEKGNYLSVENQVLNVLRLDDSYDLLMPTYSDPNIKNTIFGINFSGKGRPISYHIQGVDTAISVDNMYHHYKQTQAEQYIGIPWIVVALKYLWANENLIKDKLIASRIQAMIGLYLPDSQYTRLARNDLDGDKNLKWIAGRVFHGRPGEKPEVVQADDSIQAVLEPIQSILLHAISMTLGISYQTTTRDLVKTNMASGRLNTNEDRKTYRHIQKWFAKEVCQRDWEEFVFRMFLEGKIPGKTVADYLSDSWRYNQCQWQGPGFDFIDPQGESMAAIELNKNNMLTLQEWYGERGQDWIDALDQKAEEQEYIKSKGLYVEPDKKEVQKQSENKREEIED